MNKFLCLDMGNVLCRLNMERFIEPLSKEINLSRDDCYHFLSCTQKLQDLGLCNIGDELRVRFGIKSEYTVKSLLTAWNEILVPNYKVIDAIEILIKKYDLNVAILSNIGHEHIKYFDSIVEQHIDEGLYKAIKHYSCEVGARKPTPIYYDVFLKMYPEFKGALYVDDLKENLQMGEKFGFKTFQLDISTDPRSSYYNELKDLEKCILDG